MGERSTDEPSWKFFSIVKPCFGCCPEWWITSFVVFQNLPDLCLVLIDETKLRLLG